MADNKVRYNLSNVHYSLLTDSGEAISYASPVPWPGAVSLDLSAEGETSNFYADGIVYYTSVANNGYSGTLEMAIIPDEFRTSVLNEVEDSTSQVIYEVANTAPNPFALLFEFTGNVNPVRYVLYNITATRPTLAGATTTETREITTESLSISANPVTLNGLPIVKAKTSAQTQPETFNGWYTNVWTPPDDAG